MDTAITFLMQMRQCKRLADAAIDDATAARLLGLASEFEAKAKVAYAQAQSRDLIGERYKLPIGP